MENIECYIGGAPNMVDISKVSHFGLKIALSRELKPFKIGIGKCC